MKEKLSIGEFAKLRNITTETLRHYDRVGLLKPNSVDKKTGYRYYSILQYEQAVTIKELRQLGMSIKEIKKYFNNRNLKQSVNLLKDKHKELQSKIKELQELEMVIGEKVNLLEKNSNKDLDQIFIKEIEERRVITIDHLSTDEIESSYMWVELENTQKGIAPLVASDKLGIIVNLENLRPYKAFIEISDNDYINLEDKNKILLSRGLYVCKYYKGNIQDGKKDINKIIEYIKKEGYEICGDLIKNVQVDITVTDNINELLFELQIPIKNN